MSKSEDTFELLKEYKSVEKLITDRDLSDNELTALLLSDNCDNKLFSAADKKQREIYGDEVYIRGLIVFMNCCKNNCYYCGIRRDNKNAVRYRLTKEGILDCCEEGSRLGFRTFVLQGGEDSYYIDAFICDIVYDIRTRYRDCAITLSIGEKSKESYKAYFKAGANRYLLRHETANNVHYRKLHPGSMSLRNRKQCLYELKRYDEAEEHWKNAVDTLKKVGNHDGEIAISLVMLVHLTFERDDTAYEKVEALLDEAWKYLNSDNQPKDGNYAYILRKCAPSFDHFKRPMEAQAMREVAKEIYDRGKTC